MTGEGDNLSATQTISDKVGNSTTTTVSPIKIDRTAPVTTPSGASNDWTNNTVTVTLGATDGLSGVHQTFYKLDNGTQQTYTSGISIASEGIHSLEFWSVDKADNTESHTTIEIRIDKSAPTIGHALNPSPNANGWNNQASVQVTFTCQDQAELSGVKSCGPSPQTVATEGDQEVTGTAEDNAGNTASDKALVRIDWTKPTISGAPDRPANGNDWYNADVTVTFLCNDALSGIDTCTASSVLGEGSSQSVNGTATDNAGNSESTTVSGINIDKTKPTISGTKSPAANSNGWNNTDVTVDWTCADSGGSGLDGACPADETVSTEGSGQSVSKTIQDKASNSATSIVNNINIDKSDPSVAITSPANGATISTATTAVSGTASDLVSAVASVKVSVGGGTAQTASYNETTKAFSIASVTLSCGANTITAEATDLAGNTKSASVPVTRSCYSLNFQQPLDPSSSQATVKNTAKAGRVIPIKAEIFQGSTEQDSSNTASAPTIKVVGVPCTAGGAVDDVEAYADAGASSGNTSQFRWSADAPGFWIYNLDTKALGLQVDKCYRIDVFIGADQVTTAKWGFLQITK